MESRIPLSSRLSQERKRSRAERNRLGKRSECKLRAESLKQKGCSCRDDNVYPVHNHIRLTESSLKRHPSGYHSPPKSEILNLKSQISPFSFPQSASAPYLSLSI